MYKLFSDKARTEALKELMIEKNVCLDDAEDIIDIADRSINKFSGFSDRATSEALYGLFGILYLMTYSFRTNDLDGFYMAYKMATEIFDHTDGWLHPEKYMEKFEENE